VDDLLGQQQAVAQRWRARTRKGCKALVTIV